MLLKMDDVMPDSMYLDEFGDPADSHTVISWAAGGGHEGIVQLLLARHDVNVDSFDSGGGTLMSWPLEERTTEYCNS